MAGFTCKCCGFHSDEICCHTEIDGFDENDMEVRTQRFYCPACGSEDLEWDDGEDDFFSDEAEYRDEAMERYRLNHSEWDEREQEERENEYEYEDD